MGNTNKKTIDPVCGMAVEAKTDLTVEHQGKTYAFCAEGCREAFEKNPEKYARPKGFFRRYLDRLAKTNRQEFGSRGPCCH